MPYKPDPRNVAGIYYFFFSTLFFRKGGINLPASDLPEFDCLVEFRILNKNFSIYDQMTRGDLSAEIGRTSCARIVYSSMRNNAF
jgi:hypothetical protein